MKKSEENKTENCTILNGVVLTDKLLEQLLEFQKSENCVLREIILEPISDVICFLAENVEYCDHDKKNIISMMNSLAYIRKYLKDFAKP